jgi:hypothetical protein
VADQTDAAVANAFIALTNIEQQWTRRNKADASGEFVFVQVPPGNYMLSVEAPGFKVHHRRGLTLEVAEITVIDVRLEIGSATESIDIKGDSPLIEPGSTSLAEVITGSAIRSYPVNVRNTSNLLALTPGINTTRGFRGPGSSSGASDRIAFSAGGGRRYTNEVMLDGSPQVVMGQNQPAYIPTPDALQEFSVQTNALSAEYGRTGGAVLNLVHRSGTNEFHGAVYEFLRNDKLNANNFFLNRNGRARLPSRVNHFGAAVGGPLTRSRYSTFFFFNYEGVRVSDPRKQTFTVPSSSIKQGDFSETHTVIYDPETIDAAGRRLPFPGNRIPAGRWNRVGVNLLKLYPEPMASGLTNNFFGEASRYVAEDNYSVKIDRRLSDRHSLFGRLSVHSVSVNTNNWFGNPASPGLTLNDLRNRSATLDDTFTARGWVLHGNLGYAYSAPGVDSPTRGFDGRSLGLPDALPPASQVAVFPTITLAGQAGLGPNAAQLNGNKFETYTAAGDATRSIHAHTPKLGGVYRLNRASLFRPNAPAGAFEFDEGFTREAFNLTRGGHSVASLLLGLPSRGRIRSEPALAVQVPYAAVYIQDNWRVNARLTLNLGLRWDTDRPLTERFDRTSWFDFHADLPVTVPGLDTLRGGLVFAGCDGRPRGSKDADNNNFAPRLGIAFWLSEKIVLRSGFGVIYHPTTGTEPNAVNAGASSFASDTPVLASLDSGRTPFATLSNPFPLGFAQAENASNGLATSLGQVVSAQVRSDRVPYSAQWNLGIQYQMQDDVLLDTTYAGSAGVRLPASAQLNQLPDEFLALGDGLNRQVANPFFGLSSATGLLGASVIPAAQLLRPYPHFTGLVHVNGSFAHSSYHSFQAKLRKRYSRGLHLLAAYTWSKLLDDTSGITGGDQNPGYTNNNQRRLDKSLSALDIAHRLVVSFQYELPFGRGRRFLSRPGMTSALTAGWRLSGIATMQSGSPLSISSQQDVFSFINFQRPDSTGRTSRTPGSTRERLDKYFDPAAFVGAQPYTFGNVGRFLPDNRGPALQSWDLNLAKVVPLGEARRLEVRADLFNALNQVNFVPPTGAATVLGLRQFGSITESEAARIVQLALKLHF